MKPSDALYAAADYIRKHGWAQDVPEDFYGGRCMVGAIRSALGREPWSTDCGVAELYPVQKIIESVTGPSMVRFNDEHCETKDDAIAALEITADICAAEGR